MGRARRSGRGLAVRAVVAAALIGVAVSCGGDRNNGATGAEPSTESANAAMPAASSRPDLAEMLRADTDAARHESDGGGRVWLEGHEPAVIRAGGRGRFTFVYEVGPLGILAGGAILFQVSPFWGWSTPQADDPALPGFTTVTLGRGAGTSTEAIDAAGAAPVDSPTATPAELPVLEPSTLDQQLLGIRVTKGPLVPGDRVRVIYGASEALSAVDRFAERRSQFWFGVDGDGDGRRTLLPDPPTVDIAAGPPAILVAHLPSAADPHNTVPLSLAILDAGGSAGVEIAGTLRLSTTNEGVELPETVTIEVADRGVARVEVRVADTDVVRVHVEGPDGLAANTNPLVVSPDAQRILWADFHGHTNLSDGTGTPEDYFRYARDVAALDVGALTDHDHWGLVPLSKSPAMWNEIREQVVRFEEPGRFVALLGFEWTNWVSGHRHVVYFDADPAHGSVLSSIDPRYETPALLWEALRGSRALTFAHHPAGGPVAIDGSIAPDQALEPVVEVVSVHGSSEAPDAPIPIYSPVAGRYARDALDRGYRLGFAGSGDSHDGHPGLAHLASPSGGVAAVLADSATREAVHDALVARRVYATNGPRIVLRTVLDGARMGSSVPAAKTHKLQVVVAGTAPLAHVDVIQSGGRIDTRRADGRMFWTLEHELEPTRPGEYAYVRVVQQDGGAAWSSPYFFE